MGSPNGSASQLWANGTANGSSVNNFNSTAPTDGFKSNATEMQNLKL